ncbi:MAG: PAS domain S-box protein, partial [Gallionella sp.]|nr:PAS domain S-box protein [Gallionella sp.]
MQKHKSRGERTRHIRRLMWGAVGSVLLAVALGGYGFTRVVRQVDDEARHQSLALLHMEDAATAAQFVLARQTQEWKDILLRAYDPDQLARHRSLFGREAIDMQLHLQQTQKVIRDNGMDTANLVDLQNQEQTLLDEYAAALRKLDARDPLSYRRVDQLMRGKDRALRDGLAGWHAKLEAEIERRAKGFGASGVTGTTQFYGLGLLAVLLPLLSLTAFIAAYRALREIVRGDASVRAIYQSIGDAVLVANMRGQVESLNATAQKMTGWSDDQARGEALSDVFQLYDANNQSRVDSPAEIVLRDGCPIPMLNGMLLRRRDGKVVPVEDSAAPVLDERGKMIGVVMVFHDVSQRYAMLSDLRHERALFKQTFDLAAVGMAHLGMDGKWLRVNPKLCEITGYSEAELLQLSFKGITHPDDLARDLDKMRDLESHHIDAYHTEKRYIRKDGCSVWVALSVSFVWKEDGTPDYGISIIEDIQSRKDAEREGAAAQQQYQALFDQMPEGVLLIDENMRVIAHNRKALLELEYYSAALLQLHVRDFETADEAAIAARLQKLQKTGRDTFESRYR